LSNLGSGEFGAHRYYDYGGFYFMLCLGLAYPAQCLMTLTEPTVLILSRLVSVLFGVLSLWCLYLLGQRLFDRTTALLGTMIAMTGWVFVFWSVSDHPDLAQVFFLLMSLYGCVRLIETSSIRWLLFASFCAALSFSIKYVGVLMLPIVLLSYLVSTVADREHGGRLDLRRIGWRFFAWCAVTVFVFPAVFFVTTPYALLNLEEFVGRMRFTSSVASLGKFGVVTYGTVWLSEIGSTKILGWGLFLFVLVYLVSFSVRYVTRFRERPRQMDAQLVVVAWAVLFIAFLYWFIDYHPPHYLLPVVPVLCLFAARGAVELLGFRPVHKALRWTVCIAACLILVYAFVTRGQEVFAFWKTRINFSLAEHPIIRSGEWLERSFPADIRISSDASYNYIPRSFGLTNLEASLDSDVILVNRSAAGTYDEPEFADSYVGGREEYLRKYEFYQTLLNPRRRPADIVELRDFGPVIVYLNVSNYLSRVIHERVQARPYDIDHGITLPGRQAGGDAVYVFPVQETEKISSFEDVWGAYAVREDIHALDGEPLAWVFRITNSDLPDAADPLDVLTSARFPLTLAYPSTARFAQGVELLGYTIVSDDPAPGAPVQVDLYWLCTGDVGGDYTVFIHLIDAQGGTLGVGDKRPLDGRYPTYEWEKGDAIIERYSISTSPDGHDGPYWLEVGLYRWDTGERLPVLDSESDTAVILGPLELNPAP
jgi:hypothetical protein